ncbi:hypothetical protein BU17DRAFT_82845 [Hysterangium stoloniferum]|nr:hypothetical protein BU17DRAFT_82845 [Hysterangium stoloniferum]
MSDHEAVPANPDDVEELPPFISPAVLESSRIEFLLQSHFRGILQRQWACNVEGDGLCYHRPGRNEHVPITKDALDSWVQQMCRGFATDLDKNNLSMFSEGGT